MEINPYEAPLVDAIPVEAEIIFAEDRSLVVQSGCVLPPRCVKTNEPITKLDFVRKDFFWCSPLVILLFVACGWPALIAYFAMRKKCTLTYGVHSSLRKKRRRRILIKLAVCCSLLVALPLAAGTDSDVAVGLVFFLFLIATLVLLLSFQPVLRVSKHSNGAFWVKGCGVEFLETF